jgi:hypothetical protein
MIADLLTKAFPTLDFRCLCTMIGLSILEMKMLSLLDVTECWNSIIPRRYGFTVPFFPSRT